MFVPPSSLTRSTVVIDPQNHNRAILSVGDNDWPLPVPIVKSKGKWHFDAAAGHDEIIRRRIGTNELDAIVIPRGFVEAQHEYASTPHDGINQYAQRILAPRRGAGWSLLGDEWRPRRPNQQSRRQLDRGRLPAKPGSGYHGYNFVILHGQGPRRAHGNARLHRPRRHDRQLRAARCAHLSMASAASKPSWSAPTALSIRRISARKPANSLNPSAATTPTRPGSPLMTSAPRRSGIILSGSITSRFTRTSFGITSPTLLIDLARSLVRKACPIRGNPRIGGKQSFTVG